MIHALAAAAFVLPALAIPVTVGSNSGTLEGLFSYPVKSCDAFNSAPYSAYSCQNTTAIPLKDQCCFENFGIILLTQFWDYNPDYLNATLSGNSSALAAAKKAINATVITDEDDVNRKFTIHGLWDDLCDGSYSQECDPGLDIYDATDNITRVLVDQFGKGDLYNTMQTYWVNNVKSNVPGGGNIALWEHEFNKHGSCFNTIKPHCFTGFYNRFENTVNFWQKAVEVWSKLDTYFFLESAGITPTLDRQYNLTDVQKALKKAHGGQAYIGCLNGAIDEIWYYYNVKGNILTGDYLPIDSTSNATCPDKVWYIPK